METKQEDIQYKINLINQSSRYTRLLSFMHSFLVNNLENEEKETFRSNIRTVLEKEGLLEEDNVYKAVIQTELFELIEIPTASLFEKEGNIEDGTFHFVKGILSYYFPQAKIERHSQDYLNIVLSDEDYQRFYHVHNFITGNSSWSEFFLNELPSVYKMVMQVSSLFSYENPLNKSTISDARPRSTREVFRKEISFPDNPSLNYVERNILLRLEVSNSMFEALGSLNLLIELGMVIQFISAYYPTLVELTNREYEREQNEYLEEMSSAREDFLEREMPRHLISVEELGHKTAIAEAKRNGIDQVFLPFASNEAATTLSNIRFALYHKRADGEDSTNWFILPPTKELLDMPEYSQNGVHEYIDFRPDDVFSLSGKSPHVLNEELKSYAVLDEEFFYQVLLNDYKDDPRYGKVLQDTEFLLEKYPQLFRKTDRSILLEKPMEEEQILEEPVLEEKNNILEAIKKLKVLNTSGDISFLKEGDFIYNDASTKDSVHGRTLEDSNLFYLEKLDVQPDGVRATIHSLSGDGSQTVNLNDAPAYTKLAEGHGIRFAPNYQPELAELSVPYRTSYQNMFPNSPIEEEGAGETTFTEEFIHPYLSGKESPFCAVSQDKLIIFESGDSPISVHELAHTDSRIALLKRILLNSSNSIREMLSLTSPRMTIILVYDYGTGEMRHTLLFEGDEISSITEDSTEGQEGFPF